MNRLVPALLGVLIVLVAGNGFLVWNADRHAREDAEHAREDAERQACISRNEAITTINVVALTLVTRRDERDPDAQVQTIRSLGAELDDC